MLRTVTATMTLAAALTAGALAQSRAQGFGRGNAAWCDDGGNGDRASFCEVREETVGGRQPARRRRRPQRRHPRPRLGPRRRARAREDRRLRRHRRRGAAPRVRRPRRDRRRQRPRRRPDDGGRPSWSVSFEIQVPRTALLTLNTNNGGISIEDFHGTAKFRARNGGVTLEQRLAATFAARRPTAACTIDLAGDRWDGAGLDVETRNGGIRMTLPEHYSAALETGTTNGQRQHRFSSHGAGNLPQQLNTTLGRGGAKIRAITTNGGVTIRRR